MRNQLTRIKESDSVMSATILDDLRLSLGHVWGDESAHVLNPATQFPNCQFPTDFGHSLFTDDMNS